MLPDLGAYNFELTDDAKAILETKGHALVTGGPGSGKTSLALLKAVCHTENGLEPGQSVLFLSFSRAAVSRIAEARVNLLRDRSHAIQIWTFHSFFWHVLKAHAYLLGCPRQIRLISPQDEAALRNGEKKITKEWIDDRDRMFREEGLVCFDIFAEKVADLFSRCARIRDLYSSRHPLIIVDEAQDTEGNQWEALRQLAEQAQLVCLADLDQQIYDFRPGVSAERLTDIMKCLAPVRLDLQAVNHRSPHNEIMKFGNDVFLNTPRGGPYNGVSRLRFAPKRDARDSAIRRAVGIACEKVKNATKEYPENLAILTSWGKGVTIISRALAGANTRRAIPHHVIFDEARVLLSSRLIAFLLEPKLAFAANHDLIEALTLSARYFCARGGGKVP
jgi:ATP-dependent DNA helicase UvrD/PcrA